MSPVVKKAVEESTTIMDPSYWQPNRKLWGFPEASSTYENVRDDRCTTASGSRCLSPTEPKLELEQGVEGCDHWSQQYISPGRSIFSSPILRRSSEEPPNSRTSSQGCLSQSPKPRFRPVFDPALGLLKNELEYEMGKDSLLGAEELRERRREEELELEQAIWPPWRHEVEVWLFERQREAEEEAAKEEFYWEEVQRVEGMRQVAAWSDQTAAQQNLEMVLMAAKETNLALMTLRQQPL